MADLRLDGEPAIKGPHAALERVHRPAADHCDGQPRRLQGARICHGLGAAVERPTAWTVGRDPAEGMSQMLSSEPRHLTPPRAAFQAQATVMASRVIKALELRPPLESNHEVQIDRPRAVMRVATG